MPSQNLRVSELDFDTIKQNLITFLRSQSEFTDYNFEGSGLSVLLDILSYNTAYMGFYANMLANEAFIDTAVKRSSVVSLAKHLGYTPKSAQGATAVVDIEAIIPSNVTAPSGITLPAYSVFGSGGLNATSAYSFFNTEELIATSDNSGRFIFQNVQLKEGSINRTRFIVNSGVEDQRFVIPNVNVDMSTLVVTVQKSQSDTTSKVYIPAVNYTTITGNDPVYFTQETDGQLFEVYFGEGNVGLPVQDGNVIICDYLICNGSAANGLSQFTLQSTLQSLDDATTFASVITTTNNASGGDEIETVDTIRFFAPKAWTSQNRLVTMDDYTHFIQNNLPNVESVAVWGGETNVPPQYGKVFISLKPLTGFKFSDVAKTNFANDYISPRSLVSVIPVFVDPEYIRLGVNTLVRYDPNLTTKTQDQIVGLVRTTIQSYFNNTLEKFNQNFYFSKLAAAIDAADPSLVSNITQITVQKRIVPSLFSKIGYTIDFGPNKLHPSTLTSSNFDVVINSSEYVNSHFEDLPDQLNFSTSYSGSGTIRLVSSSGTVLLSNLGTIDYATGLITINPMEFIDAKANDGTIVFTVTLQESSLDVFVVRNNIIILDDTIADPLAGLDTNGLVVAATTQAQIVE
jgi:hypothetical protein